MASFKKNRKASDNPHFFKVVLAHALEEQKLEIPKKFVKQHGVTALSKNGTCLKVGDGREWDVGLTKSNGRVWFHDHGWQKFVEFYSVGLDYFLVFKYDYNFSNFYVVIFDLTATEIEYPSKQICVHEAEQNVKMETCLDDSYPQDYKVGEVSFRVKKSMNSEYEERNPTPGAIPAGLIVAYKRKDRTRATEEATAFQSMTLNPSFMSKISPSCISRRRITVPKGFTEMHMEKTIEIRLEVSYGKVWDIRCCVSFCTRMQRRRAELGHGLKKFVHDNNLKVGDACVFEMLNKNSRRISFKVTIFRAP